MNILEKKLLCRFGNDDNGEVSYNRIHRSISNHSTQTFPHNHLNMPKSLAQDLDKTKMQSKRVKAQAK